MIFSSHSQGGEPEGRKQRASSSGTRRVSVVDMLSKVPVNRQSLIKSVESLLKTIESSESAVMIPTLLRDKCDFDACELLFVAKILKASILGHSDLVEFYINHVGTSNLIKGSPGAEFSQASQHGHQLSPSPASSTSTASQTQTAYETAQAGSSSLAGWAAGSLSTSTSSSAGSAQASEPSPSSSGEGREQQALLAALGSKPLAAPATRQAQPPSLLQLTTNNNHINSLAHSSLEPAPSQPAEFPELSLNLPGAPAGSRPEARSLTPTASVKATASSVELKSSRSAGCLFRLNGSGPTSPRTPQPPNIQELLQSGDASAPIRLLYQIEQLKASIAHVTSLLESVVELYKESIDNLA